jgi:two-component system, OmpR family, response regulator
MATPPRVLVIEDDPSVAGGLVRGLRAAGFAVELATDGASGARLALAGGVGVVLLDLMLPELSGFEVLEALRTRASAPPVIVLTARVELDDRLRAFGLGAADFVPKPFWIEEIVARIRARLPGAERARPARTVAWADAVVDLEARTVRIAGESVALTRVELDLLAYLVERPGRAIPREQLSRAVAVVDDREDRDERTVDSHVSRLRRKLGVAASAIATVWGIGYRFDPPEAG